MSNIAKMQERVRGEIWDLYADLKAYRRHPDSALVPALAACCDAIFTQRTSFATLNQTLKRLHAHKEKLLLVLKGPASSCISTAAKAISAAT